MYAAYKSGVEALSFLRNSKGLTLEAVEDIQAEMHELVEEGDEIAAVLGEGMVTAELTLSVMLLLATQDQ